MDNELKQHLSEMESRLDGAIGSESERLMNYLLDFRGEVLLRFSVVESRLDALANSVKSIDMRLPALAQAVDGSSAALIQFARHQSTAKTADMDLATRVAKLEETVAKLQKPAA